MKDIGPRFSRVAGELLVIVAGVLIALWADGLVGMQRDRQAIRGHLAAVRTEFLREMTSLDGLLAQQREELEALRFISGLRADSMPPDSVVMQSVAVGLTNVLTYEPSLGALGSLESSGLLSVVESAELRRAIASLRQRLNTLAISATVNQTGPQQSVMDPFVLEELPFVWEEMARLTPTVDRGRDRDWSALLTPHGRGLVAMRADFLQATAEEWTALRTHYEEAASLIDGELGEEREE